MKSLSGTALVAAIGLALLPAGNALAAEVTPEQRAAYLACYRRVLMMPEFALLDSASLYRIRNEQLARTVILACTEEIQPYRIQLLETALRAPAPTAGAPRPDGWLFTSYESGLRQRVADDLVEAAPRVKAIADAEAGKPAERAEQ